MLNTVLYPCKTLCVLNLGINIYKVKTGVNWMLNTVLSPYKTWCVLNLANNIFKVKLGLLKHGDHLSMSKCWYNSQIVHITYITSLHNAHCLGDVLCHKLVSYRLPKLCVYYIQSILTTMLISDRNCNLLCCGNWRTYGGLGWNLAFFCLAWIFQRHRHLKPCTWCWSCTRRFSINL